MQFKLKTFSSKTVCLAKLKMSQPAQKSFNVDLLSLLKVNNKGWNIALFKDTNNVSDYLCAHCNSVCCDAVELGCDHDDNDIFLHCKQCLSDLIINNDNKCIINSHINPSLTSVRATRRTISKSAVVCPYSTQFKTRINNTQIMNTVGANTYDEKEGNQQFIIETQSEINNKCQWEGTLIDLITQHICECSKKNDPTFALNLTIKKLQHENMDLKQEMSKLKNTLNAQQQIIYQQQKELNDKNKENVTLTQILQQTQENMNQKFQQQQLNPMQINWWQRGQQLPYSLSQYNFNQQNNGNGMQNNGNDKPIKKKRKRRKKKKRKK
eukprot:333783_1